MKTSMPSTPNDLAALVSGANPAGANSLLKGIFAGLNNARSGTAETGGGDGADFESLLDAPPAPAEELSVATRKLATGLSARKDRNHLPVFATPGRCVLTSELSLVAAGALQIKGMSLVSDQPVVPAVTMSTLEKSGIEESLSEPSSAEVPPVAVPGQAQVALPNQPVIFPPALVTENNLDLENAAPGFAQPVSIETSESDSGDDVAPPVLIADQAELPETNTSTSISADNGVPSEPVRTGQGSIATVQAPAKGLRTHALQNRPAGQHFERSDRLLPAVKNHECAVATAPGVPGELTVEVPLKGEFRREVIETVAALLAPLWASLPQVFSGFSGNATEGDADGSVTLNGGGENLFGAAVTIKLGSRPPFTINLPFFDSNVAVSGPSSPLLQGSEEAMGVAAGEPRRATAETARFESARTNLGTVVSELAQTRIPGTTPRGSEPQGIKLAVLDSVIPNVVPMDFRIQLRAKIETALEKIAPLRVEEAPEMIPAARKEEAKSDAFGFARRAVRTDSEGTKTVTPPGTNQDFPIKAVAPLVGSVQVLAPKSANLTTPVELSIEIPGFGSLTAQVVAAQAGGNLSEKKPVGRLVRAEKSAGDFPAEDRSGKAVNTAAEKTFLSAAGQLPKSKDGKAGTDVAKSDDNMPAQFTSRRLAVEPLELPPRFNGRGELLPALNESQKFMASAETRAAPTPAPVLAHRAVETIMNVVDAQRHGSANASSVNLHFKFGGDDLAVRVQMRGGEVLTQFLTDSAELRSALSSEWQILAGQGGAAGLRLLDPTILPASAGVSNGFGSPSQGQSQAQQQHAQQQEAQAAGAFPEFRALRRGVSPVAPATEATPRISIQQPTSHHLTAMA